MHANIAMIVIKQDAVCSAWKYIQLNVLMLIDGSSCEWRLNVVTSLNILWVVFFLFITIRWNSNSVSPMKVNNNVVGHFDEYGDWGYNMDHWNEFWIGTNSSGWLIFICLWFFAHYVLSKIEIELLSSKEIDQLLSTESYTLLSTEDINTLLCAVDSNTQLSTTL